DVISFRISFCPEFCGELAIDRHPPLKEDFLRLAARCDARCCDDLLQAFLHIFPELLKNSIRRLIAESHYPQHGMSPVSQPQMLPPPFQGRAPRFDPLGSRLQLPARPAPPSRGLLRLSLRAPVR